LRRWAEAWSRRLFVSVRRRRSLRSSLRARPALLRLPGGVRSVVGSGPRLDAPEAQAHRLVRQDVQQRAVVRHDHAYATEALERSQQELARGDVEVVGRLVEQ
jgi:hypothetical protein